MKGVLKLSHRNGQHVMNADSDSVHDDDGLQNKDDASNHDALSKLFASSFLSKMCNHGTLLVVDSVPLPLKQKIGRIWILTLLSC